MLLFTPYIKSSGSGPPPGNPELLPNPGFDDGTHWVPPAGCTIQNGAAEWRTAGAFSTLTSVLNTASMAPVSASTDYTVGATITNYTSGGNFQLGVSWYTSGGGIISTDEAAVSVTGNGFVSRALATSPGTAAFATFRAKPWGANYNLDFDAASIKAT